MDAPHDLRALFDAVAAGRLTPEAALAARRDSLAENLGYACVDHDRARRCGHPEVVFAAGKTPEQTIAILESIHGRHGFALATRVPPETAAAAQSRWPGIEHHPAARTLLLGDPPAPAEGTGEVLVISAGTSDLPVAEEACVTVRAFGAPVRSLRDVGVAGLHRLLGHMEDLRRAAALVVVAGMEGALPSVVGGLVGVPVVGVPTSVGYGASFGGVAALLGMLNACASGVSVVNIDNGFGAGVVAARIALASRPTS